MNELKQGMPVTDPSGEHGVIVRITPDARFVVVRWADHTTTSHLYATVLTWV
ncbi:MAG: hypothetical protein ABR585_12570 [Gemmatimonadaceae bacterium]